MSNLLAAVSAHAASRARQLSDAGVHPAPGQRQLHPPRAVVYTIIGGVNCTGKSSLTGVLRIQTTDTGKIIDVDKITSEGAYTAIEGGKVALRYIQECLDRSVSFTQEMELSGRKTEVTAAQAKRRGYYIRLYYVGLDTPKECLARIENRLFYPRHIF